MRRSLFWVTYRCWRSFKRLVCVVASLYVQLVFVLQAHRGTTVSVKKNASNWELNVNSLTPLAVSQQHLDTSPPQVFHLAVRIWGVGPAVPAGRAGLWMQTSRLCKYLPEFDAVRRSKVDFLFFVFFLIKKARLAGARVQTRVLSWWRRNNCFVLFKKKKKN